MPQMLTHQKAQNGPLPFRHYRGKWQPVFFCHDCHWATPMAREDPAYYRVLHGSGDRHGGAAPSAAREKAAPTVPPAAARTAH